MLLLSLFVSEVIVAGMSSVSAPDVDEITLIKNSLLQVRRCRSYPVPHNKLTVIVSSVSTYVLEINRRERARESKIL